MDSCGLNRSADKFDCDVTARRLYFDSPNRKSDLLLGSGNSARAQLALLSIGTSTDPTICTDYGVQTTPGLKMSGFVDMNGFQADKDIRVDSVFHQNKISALELEISVRC